MILVPSMILRSFLTSVPSFLWVPSILLVPSMILRSFPLLVLWMISIHGSWVPFLLLIYQILGTYHANLIEIQIVYDLHLQLLLCRKQLTLGALSSCVGTSCFNLIFVTCMICIQLSLVQMMNRVEFLCVRN